MLSKAMRFVRQREINKRMENEKKEEMARIASEKEQEVRAKKRAAAKAAADRRKARNAVVEEQAAVKQRRVTTYVNMVAHVSGAWRFRAMGELKSLEGVEEAVKRLQRAARKQVVSGCLCWSGRDARARCWAWEWV